MKKALLSLAAILLAVSAFAQMRYGFKTGLNFATIRGPIAQDAASANLEKIENVTGFSIGATFGYGFTDNFGIRGEFLYSKRGMKYTYEGAAYRYFSVNNTPVLTRGNDRYLVVVNNSYIDIPILGYAKAGNFEFNAGTYVGFLVQSTGEGSSTYNGKPDNSNKVTGDLKFSLQHNYYQDKPGEFKADDVITAQVGDRVVEVPKIHGAYYDYSEDKGNLYNTIDYGVLGGVSYFVSRSLYVGVRLQYGLADVSNNKVDFVKAAPDENGAKVFSEDKDRNFNIQATVGFSF